jgi:hypothetical protein
MSYTIARTIALTVLCAVSHVAVSATHPDEILTTPAAGKQPHILMVLFDDYGWADAGWHRNYTAPGGAAVPYTEEVQTPTLNGLVQSGIELNRNYIYKVPFLPHEAARTVHNQSSHMAVHAPHHFQHLHIQRLGLAVPSLRLVQRRQVVEVCRQTPNRG